MKEKIILILISLSIFNVLISQDQCLCIDFVKAKKSGEPDSLLIKTLLNNSDATCRAKGFEMMGDFLTNEGKLDSAELFLLKAEQLFKKAHCNDSFLLNTYKIWAQLYYSKADFPKAQEYSLKMVSYAEAAGKYYDQAKGYTMIAQLFNQTNQAEKE